MKIKLDKPISANGREITLLNLELESLTGNDLLTAEDEMKRKGLTVAAWEYSREFLCTVAARALKLPSESLKELSAKTFTQIINEVLSFLAGTEPQTATE